MLLYNEHILKKKKRKQGRGNFRKNGKEEKSSPFLHKDSTDFYKLDLQWGEMFFKRSYYN